MVEAGADVDASMETGGFALEATEVFGSKFFEHGFWILGVSLW